MFIGHCKLPVFKYLGVKLEADLSDALLKTMMQERLKDHLDKVDATVLKGPENAWIVSFIVCQMEIWDLFHKLVHKKYRKWIGLAKSAEGSILYRPTNQFGLGFVNLTDLHKQHPVTKWHIMKC